MSFTPQFMHLVVHALGGRLRMFSIHVVVTPFSSVEIA
jgi:hypothetical protein